MKWRAQKAVAGIAAAIAAVYGTTMLWGVGYVAWSLADAGSGGIGAVSSGLLEVVIPLAMGTVTNRALAHWARRAGGATRTIHRVHTITLILIAVMVVLLVVELAGLGVGPLWIVTGLIAAFTLAAQSLLLAVILALFATQTAVSES